MRTILEIEETNSLDFASSSNDTRDLSTLEALEERMFVATQPLFSGNVDPLVNNLEREFVADYASGGPKSRPSGTDSSPRGVRAMINALPSMPSNLLFKGDESEEKYSEAERALIAEYDGLRMQLRKRKLTRGIWMTKKNIGSKPCSREGATLAVANGKIYLFGGFARTLFNDIRTFDPFSHLWSLLPLEKQTLHAPAPRF